MIISLISAKSAWSFSVVSGVIGTLSTSFALLKKLLEVIQQDDEEWKNGHRGNRIVLLNPTPKLGWPKFLSPTWSPWVDVDSHVYGDDVDDNQVDIDVLFTNRSETLILLRCNTGSWPSYPSLLYRIFPWYHSVLPIAPQTLPHWMNTESRDGPGFTVIART